MNSEPSPLRDGVIFRKKEDQEAKLRASRVQRLSSFEISFSTIRVMDYCEEAKNTFTSGCFRSCIICSAIAVELALKHFLISVSEEWEEAYWEMEMKKPNFSQIIKRLKNSNRDLVETLKDADWLRKARNEIVAHPLYVGNTFEVAKSGHLEMTEFEHHMWASKTMLRDIRKLLRFVEPATRRTIEEKKFTKRDGSGRTLEEFSVMDHLKQRKPVRYELTDFLYWKAIQNELIEEIAFGAYGRMVSVINSLFPKNDTC